MVQTAKLSVDEYHRIVASGALGDRRIELLNAELVELSPEPPAHANQNNKVFKYLLSRFDGVADVRSHHPISLPTSEPEPDIVLAQLPESRYDTRHPVPDDIYLVLEVSYSTLDYDLETKRSLYALAGIRDYWILDLQTRRLIVFSHLENTAYQHQSSLTEGVITLPQFPQIDLQVERLLQ